MEIRLASVDDLELFLPAKEAFFVDYSVSKKERESGEKMLLEDVSLKSRSFYEEEFSEFLKGSLILAIDGGKVVGYLAGKVELNPYEEYGYISEVFVKSDFRGKGVSTLLKDKFLGILKEKKIDLCRVEVSPGNPAEGLYLKWGFEVDKHRLSIGL